jgi:hypothetical protein
MKKSIIIIAVILTCIFYNAKAQPGSTGGFDDEPQDAPIDGGIILLVSASAAYGYKKMKNRRRNINTKNLIV